MHAQNGRPERRPNNHQHVTSDTELTPDACIVHDLLLAEGTMTQHEIAAYSGLGWTRALEARRRLAANGFARWTGELAAPDGVNARTYAAISPDDPAYGRKPQQGKRKRANRGAQILVLLAHAGAAGMTDAEMARKLGTTLAAVQRARAKLNDFVTVAHRPNKGYWRWRLHTPSEWVEK